MAFAIFILGKNATLYEVYHEVIHAKQFAKIGREAYEALGRLSREEHVLNEILKSKIYSMKRK